LMTSKAQAVTSSMYSRDLTSEKKRRLEIIGSKDILAITTRNGMRKSYDLQCNSILIQRA
jgi:hypothetical protein